MPSFDIPAVYMYLKKFRCVDDSCQIVGITLLVQGTTFVKWTGKHIIRSSTVKENWLRERQYKRRDFILPLPAFFALRHSSVKNAKGASKPFSPLSTDHYSDKKLAQRYFISAEVNNIYQIY